MQILPVLKDTLEGTGLAHFVQISITFGKKQILHYGKLMLKYGSTVVKFFQLVKNYQASVTTSMLVPKRVKHRREPWKCAW